jgi:hypothetical protein
MPVTIHSTQHPAPDLRLRADELVREAFEAGRLYGYAQAEREMKAQLDGFAAQIQTSISQAVQRLVVPGPEAPTQVSQAVESEEQTGKPAASAYGAKKAAVRKVIATSPSPGLKMVNVRDRVRHLHGLDLSPTQVREALRALQADGDAICIDRTWWRQTDQLREKTRNENGAPNGEATSAPEVGEVAASPIEIPNGRLRDLLG